MCFANKFELFRFFNPQVRHDPILNNGNTYTRTRVRRSAAKIRETLYFSKFTYRLRAIYERSIEIAWPRTFTRRIFDTPKNQRSVSQTRVKRPSRVRHPVNIFQIIVVHQADDKTTRRIKYRFRLKTRRAYHNCGRLNRSTNGWRRSPFALGLHQYLRARARVVHDTRSSER